MGCIFWGLEEGNKVKLIYCRECTELVRLRAVMCTCPCGKSSGRYINDIEAEISGPCIPIGIDNSGFMAAVKNPKKGLPFCGFVILEGGRVKRK